MDTSGYPVPVRLEMPGMFSFRVFYFSGSRFPPCPEPFGSGHFSILEVEDSLDDIGYMRMALRLARRGVGWVSPNPMVGALVVKEGRIIGRGWHKNYGEAHAERNALAACSESPRGATLYVTLEPCCHQGKQPPCVDAILEAGIRRVVVGSPDPNPLVAGKGLQALRRAGIQVEEGVLQEACDQLNQVFFHYIQTGRPFVVLKYAMTLDGKIAAHTGASQWITGEAARAHVQRQRQRYAAILVGVGTILEDNPLLTCRISGARQPLRVVCDSSLRTPLDSRLVSTSHHFPTLLATCCADPQRWRPYEEAGCRIALSPGRDGRVDLSSLLQALGREGIDSVLAEGGGTLHWSLLEQGLVQKVLAYLSPKLLGGRTAKTPVEGKGFPHPDQAVHLQRTHITRLGEDFLIEGKVAGDVHRHY